MVHPARTPAIGLKTPGVMDHILAQTVNKPTSAIEA